MFLLFDGFVLAKLDLSASEDPLWKTYDANNLPLVAFFHPDGTRLTDFDLEVYECDALFAERLTNVRKKLGMHPPTRKGILCSLIAFYVSLRCAKSSLPTSKIRRKSTGIFKIPK